MASVQLNLTRTETDGRAHVSANAVVMDTKPRPYYLFVTARYVTVVFDPQPVSPRGRVQLGKTFNGTAAEQAEQVRRAYKRDGSTLADVIGQAAALLTTGRGDGSRMLLTLCNLADYHGVTLELMAAPLDYKGSRKAKMEAARRLVAWYGRFGFRGTFFLMTRKPNAIPAGAK